MQQGIDTVWDKIAAAEPVWSLVIAAVALGISIWSVTVGARRAAKKALLSEMLRIKRDQNRASFEPFRAPLLELLDLLSPLNVPQLELEARGGLFSAETVARLNDQATKLLNRAELLNSNAFMLSLQLISNVVMLEAPAAAYQSIGLLALRLRMIADNGLVEEESLEGVSRELDDMWSKASSEVAAMIRRIEGEIAVPTLQLQA